MTAPPVVLSVAGTDSGGAAGLAADVTTIGHLGCHAAGVVTAVTAQDTTGVHAVHPVPVDVVAAQVDAVLDDLPVAVVKTGMLGSLAVVRLVAERLGSLPLVVDPVLVATSGAVLGDGDVARAYVECLLPVATVTTPNLDEARALTGCDEAPAGLAERLADRGCAVLLTGGPQWEPEWKPPWRPGDASCTDWLCLPGARAEPLTHRAVFTTADHGTGCTFSSALAAGLAIGDDLVAAAGRAASYVTTQLATSRTWDLGRGRGPIAHTTPDPSTPKPRTIEEPA